MAAGGKRLRNTFNKAMDEWASDERRADVQEMKLSIELIVQELKRAPRKIAVSSWRNTNLGEILGARRNKEAERGDRIGSPTSPHA